MQTKYDVLIVGAGVGGLHRTVTARQSVGADAV